MSILPEDQWTPTYLGNVKTFSAATQVNSEKVFEIVRQGLEQKLEQAEASSQVGIPELISALQNLQPVQPVVNSSPNSKSVKFPDPELYNGTRVELYPHITALRNKLSINADHFLDEQAKIKYAYSRLGSVAANRMRNEFRNFTDPAAPVTINSIDEYVQKLKQYFDDPSRKEKADQKVLSTFQANRPFIDFLADFEEALLDSSYAEHRDLMVNRLQAACSYELRQTFITAPPPQLYNAFTQHCIETDAKIRRLTPPSRSSNFASKSAVSNSAPSYTSNRVPPVPPPKPSNLVSSVTPSERTVLQGGNRMDLDNLANQRTPDNHLTEAARNARSRLGQCWRCKETGHIARNCPRSDRNIRSCDMPDSNAIVPHEEQLKD